MKCVLRLFWLLCFALLLLSCAAKPSKQAPYHTRLYSATYDDAWLAALRALSDYPLKLSNKDTGKIFTEIVNGPYNELLFAHPDTIPLPERFRFSLQFNLAKVGGDEELTPTNEERNVIRIRVIKKLEQYRDFYTGWVPYPSDGLEERVLLYRVEHLAQMDQALRRASKAESP